MGAFIAIDMKSFYASVECVYRDLDPLKANLLVADDSRSDATICLAVSPSLKAKGVPGRPRLFEAKQAITTWGKQNRKKLNNAYSGKSPLVGVFFIGTNEEIMLRSTNGRAMIFDTALLLPKTTRDTQGVQVMTLKTKGALVEKAFILTAEQGERLAKYRSKTIPVAGSFAKDIPDPDQMSLI